MVTAGILINQAGKPAGVVSTSREDLSLGATVVLSNNSDTGVVFWSWSLLSKPPGSASTISGASSPNCSFVPDVVGSYLIRLTVSDLVTPSTDERIAAVVTPNLGIRIPVSRETTQYDDVVGWQGAIYNAFTDIDDHLIDSRAPTGPATGDLSSNYPAPIVAKIQGRSVSSTAPTDGYALVWNATAAQWKPSYQGTRYLSEFADLSTAISSIGSIETTLIINRNTSISANLTVPTNVTLQFTSNNEISILSGAVLTINGDIKTSLQKIFNVVSGSVVRDIGLVSVVFPEWWGALGNGNLGVDFDLTTAHDDTVAVQSAISFFQNTINTNGGIVYFGAKTYKCTNSITLYDQVVLRGIGCKKHNGLNGSILAFKPTTPKSFIHASPIVGPYMYCNIESLGIIGDNAGNALNALHIIGATSHLKDVLICYFHDTLLNIEYPINSRFELVTLAGNDTAKRTILLTGEGIEVSPGPGTTCTFSECTFGGANDDGYSSVEIVNQTNVLFEHCIFQSNHYDVISIDNVILAQFLHSYFEGNIGHYFKVGSTTLVRKLITEGTFCLGTTDGLAMATDYFNLDRVSSADVDVSYVGSGIKASVVRTTTNTGRVNLRSASYNVSIVTSATARQNSYSYAVGDRIGVVENAYWGSNPRTLVFVCVSAGISAGSNPGTYYWGYSNITDGCAVFSHSAKVVAPYYNVTVIDDDTPYIPGSYTTLNINKSVYKGYINKTGWNVGVHFNQHPEEFMIFETNQLFAPLCAYPTDADDNKAGRMALGVVGDYSLSHRIKLSHETEINRNIGLPSISNPTPVANHGLLYVKDIKNNIDYRNELMYLDNYGYITQLTNAGKLFTGPVNVKWYGAKGDGITDDAVAIQNALNDAYSVYLPAGTYYFNTNLIVPNYTTMRGDGDKTVLKPGAAVKFALSYGLTCSISDMHLDGSLTTGCTGIRNTPTGYGVTTLSSVKRCFIGYFSGNDGYGLDMNQSVSCIFEELYVAANDIGLYINGVVQSTPTTSKFIKCYFTGNAKQGTLIRTGYMIDFDHCVFESNYQHGVYLNARGDILQVTLNRCWFEGNWRTYNEGTPQRQDAYAFATVNHGRTIRPILRDCYWNVNANTERAAQFDYCTPYVLEDPQVGASRNGIFSVINYSYGTVRLPLNIPNTAVAVLPTASAYFPSYATSWTDWTPSFTAFGSMTVTGTSVSKARYAVVDKIAHVNFNFTATLGGTPSTAVEISLPPGVAPPASDFYIPALARDGDGTYVNAVVRVLTSRDGYFAIYKQSSTTNWATGSQFSVIFSGTFEIV